MGQLYAHRKQIGNGLSNVYIDRSPLSLSYLIVL